MNVNKVIDRLTKEHGYDFESEFFTDEIKTLVSEVMEATEHVVNSLHIERVSDLLPIGTTVTIENDKSEWGSKAGKELKITGYCAWKDDPKGGYEVDGEGIYLREDFIGL